MTEQDIADLATAELGESAEKFLDTDVGRYMLQIAQQDRLLAMEALEMVDPADTKKIMELQMVARFGRMFEENLQKLMDAGKAAVANWEQRQRQSKE